MEKISVEFRSITKRFGQVVAVDDVSFVVPSGMFLTLLGPSGCGKTTILRMVGGFEQPSSGEIFLMGRPVTHKSASHRETHMVFQNYALFPHKTVGQNIGFGLKMQGRKKAEINKEVRAMLELINLPDIFDRMPHQLSGGQQQRVALARALILKPPVLLLDEPLGALDAKIRKQLQIELKQLQRELGITFIYVTHDQEEAMTMSDTIGILNQGKIEQLGRPEEIYEKPKTEFVARFVGECNFLTGIISGLSQDLVDVQDGKGRAFRVTNDVSTELSLGEADKVTLAVRPEDIRVGAEATQCVNQLTGRVKETLYTGVVLRVVIEVEGESFIVDAHKGASFRPSDVIRIGWDPSAGAIIPRD
jgi:spermidine/putrescine transport system ATP-binding protein